MPNVPNAFFLNHLILLKPQPMHGRPLPSKKKKKNQEECLSPQRLCTGYWNQDSHHIFNFHFQALRFKFHFQALRGEGRSSGGWGGKGLLRSPLSFLSPVPPGEPAPSLSSKLFKTFNWILMRSGESYFDKKIAKLS